LKTAGPRARGLADVLKHLERGQIEEPLSAPSTASAPAGIAPAALFGSFFGTTQQSDFPRPWLIVVRPWASRCALHHTLPSAAQKDAGSPGSRARCFRACSGSVTARGSVPPRRYGKDRCGLRCESTTSAPRTARESPHGAWITRLNTRPARTPVNASSEPLRVRTHDSGPPWLAKPSAYDSFIHNISPVLTGARIRTHDPLVRRRTY
jgi:hypothetical protein